MAQGRVSISVERCKACGFCVEFCPTKVLARSSAFIRRAWWRPKNAVAAIRPGLGREELSFRT